MLNPRLGGDVTVQEARRDIGVSSICREFDLVGMLMWQGSRDRYLCEVQETRNIGQDYDARVGQCIAGLDVAGWGPALAIGLGLGAYRTIDGSGIMCSCVSSSL